MNDHEHDDLVSAGFERLDPTLIERRPPKIQWGMIYKTRWSKDEKIAYLEKLAATMNQAAAKIQAERDELGRLCELKEQQLLKLAEAVRQNNAMLQQEITEMNAQRQDYNEDIARLNTELRALKRSIAV
jgi:uncharacterized coiled-coil DUF342 family protein